MNRFKHLLIKPPYALTLDEWDEWNAKTKADKPIRWFFYDTVPSFINIHIWWPFKRIFYDGIWWGFKYRFIRKHQYHIIRPKTLEPGYHDPVELILHTSFHLLVEFVDYQRYHNCVDWSATTSHANAWAEMEDLYDWWVNKRPNRDDKLMKHFPYPKAPEGVDDFCWALKEKYNETDESIRWSEISSIHRTHEELFELEDERNLQRLTKIRTFMWY